MDIQLVLERLTAAAATAVSTPAQTMTAYGYFPDTYEPPCIFPGGLSIDFDQTYGRGLDKLTVTLQLLVAHIDDRESQRMVYGYLKGAGASSVKAAIEANDTLTGACDDLRVTGVSEVGSFDHQGDRYLSVNFTVEIYGTGA